ncbi:MAG: TlpA family protein disulfide reductase [Candidatus Aminicenantes bacterium]|nr:TlpA family protein disulfide reductase [Candidatus Aminicenantes bacterium]
MIKFTIPIKIVKIALFFSFISNLLFANFLKPGDDLKPFSLQAVDGRIFKVFIDNEVLTLQQSDSSGNLLATIRPEVILLDFWATWCLPCRAALPHLERLYNHFQTNEKSRDRVIFLGLVLDKQGAAIVKPFLQKIKLSYPQLCSSTNPSQNEIIRSPQEMALVYKIQEIPVVYIINRQGKIVYAHVGFKEEYIKEIEKVISNLLGINQGK